MNFIKLINEKIEKNTEITNWSVKNNVKVLFYIFLYTESNNCFLKQPKTQKIYKIKEESFQFLYKHWSDYLSGKITRHELRDMDYSTTYTICIMHYLMNKGLLK